MPTLSVCRLPTLAALLACGALAAAAPAAAQSDDIPLAPEPPPLNAPTPERTERPTLAPQDAAPQNGSPQNGSPQNGSPQGEPGGTPQAPAGEAVEAPVVLVPERKSEPEAAPAPEPEIVTSQPAAQPGSGVVSSAPPIPPRRPPVPENWIVRQAQTAEPQRSQQAAYTSETSQRFGRDLDEPRAGFARVEGDMFWDEFTIGTDGRKACTGRAAVLGASLAASFKENGVWVPGEPLRLSVPCETPDGREIALACVAQDRAPVLDLSCRID
jgi:hypothetical protein